MGSQALYSSFFIAAPQTVIHRVAMPTAAECLAKAQELLKADAGGQELG